MLELWKAESLKLPEYCLLGHAPKLVKKNGNEYWFLSLFKEENTASFKVKKDDNIWYDHGQGKGGNILDFVMLFKNIDFKAALFF